MERYLKRCESHVTAKACRVTEEEEEMLSGSKRRKFYPQLKNEDLCCGEAAPTTDNSVLSPSASRANSGGDIVEKRSLDLENVDDLQSESLGTGISASVDRVSREATPTSELYGDSEESLLQPFSSSSKKKPKPHSLAQPISRRKISERTPSAAELEEFFAAAEKYDQKRFAEKYNYDIAKDIPLEGKYQWVRLHP